MNIVRSVDFFPKIVDSVENTRSVCGGIMFVLTLFLSTFLFYRETQSFLYGKTIYEPYIDKSQPLHSNIRVNINISVYDIPCAAISLDYFDINGASIENIHHTLYKLRIGPSGYLIEGDKVEMIRSAET